MKAGYTHFSVIIDQSGSMQTIKADTEGGLNSFIETQKATPGEATASLTVFNANVTLVHDFINIQDFPAFTLSPNGNTAMLDAIGTTINGLGAKLAAMAEEDRPEKVAVIIITDGEENASREFDYAAISRMIETQTNDYKWEFVFLGANINAEVMARRISIRAEKAMTFAANAQGVSATYGSLTKNMSAYRGCSIHEGATMDFDLADRTAQEDALKVNP